MPSKLTKSSAYFVDMEYSNIIYIRLDNGDRYSYHYETLKYIENYKENVTNYNISKYDIRYKHIDNYVDFLINVSRVIENYNYSLFLSIIEPLSLIMEDFVNRYNSRLMLIPKIVSMNTEKRNRLSKIYRISKTYNAIGHKALNFRLKPSYFDRKRLLYRIFGITVPSLYGSYYGTYDENVQKFRKDISKELYMVSEYDIEKYFVDNLKEEHFIEVNGDGETHSDYLKLVKLVKRGIEKLEMLKIEKMASVIKIFKDISDEEIFLLISEAYDITLRSRADLLVSISKIPYNILQQKYRNMGEFLLQFDNLDIHILDIVYIYFWTKNLRLNINSILDYIIINNRRDEIFYISMKVVNFIINISESTETFEYSILDNTIDIKDIDETKLKYMKCITKRLPRIYPGYYEYILDILNV